MTPTRPEGSSAGVFETGDFVARLICRAIDFAVFFACAFVGFFIAVTTTFLALQIRGRLAPDWVEHAPGPHFSLWAFSAFALGTAVSEGLGGTTVGKLVLGYRVVGAGQQPCTLSQALVRSAARFIDEPMLGLVALISMGRGTENQRLGDRLARTWVARRATLSPSAVRSSGSVLVGIAFGLATYIVVVVIGLTLGVMT